MCARLARLCRGVKPLLQHLVQNHRRGGAHIERLDAPEQRQRDEVVAHRRDARAQALCPRRRAPRRRRRCSPAGRSGWSRRRPRRRPSSPSSFASRRKSARFFTRAIGDVLDRARRRLADRGRDLGAAPLGDDHRGRPGGLRRPADRAEVLRVGDLVERDEQRVSVASSSVGVRVRIRVDERARRPGGRRTPARSSISSAVAIVTLCGAQSSGVRRPDPVHLALARAAPPGRGCARR